MPLLRAEAFGLSRGGRTLLDGRQITVNAGERWAIQGPSGTGKTSLLRALARLDPYEGRLSLRDVPAAEIPPPIWRAQVTWVSAETALNPSSVEQALRAPFGFKAVQGVFDAAVIRGILAELGLESLDWSTSTDALSAGQRQRLALARALSIEPMVLLADEPTAHLDPDTRDRVVDALARFSDRDDRAVIVVAHDPAVIAQLRARVMTLGGPS